MEKENKVSIWIGYCENKDLLENLFLERYNEDGDMESDFMLSFKLDYIDNQFQEIDFRDKLQHKVDAFKEFSYWETFLDQLPEKEWSDFNVIICLYNYEYTGTISSANKIEFLGVFDYKNI